MRLQRLVAAALLTALAVAAPGPTRAQIRTGAVTPAIAERIDALLEAAIVHQHLPGVAVAVERDGEVIYARGYGYRQLGQHARADEHTVYNIASASKQFAASSIMLLAQAGKLRVDDRLSRYFPDYRYGARITLRQMLNHTSGIPDYTDLPNVPQDAGPLQDFALVRKLPPAFAPGSRYEYSNTNYVLLALIVQKVSGEPYGRFVTERLFRPTGMDDASIHRLPSGVPDGATGYSWDGKKIVAVPRTPDDFGFGDGDVNASVVDLMKWDAALDGGRVVDAASWREMTTIPAAQGESATSGYGFGLELDRLNGRRYVYHGGAQYGFKTVNGTLPDQRFAVVLVSNSDAFYQYWLVKQIIALFYPRRPVRPRQARPVTSRRSGAPRWRSSPRCKRGRSRARRASPRSSTRASKARGRRRGGWPRSARCSARCSAGCSTAAASSCIRTCSRFRTRSSTTTTCSAATAASKERSSSVPTELDLTVTVERWPLRPAVCDHRLRVHRVRGSGGRARRRRSARTRRVRRRLL